MERLLKLPPPDAAPDLLIVAGEHSGDQHAARLVRAFLKKKPDAVVYALGGPALEQAGARLLFDLTASSVVGLVEVLRHYRFFKALFDESSDWIASCRPRAVLFVDYPGFNLRLAKQLVAQGIAVKGGGSTRLLYYIGPQIWAWKAKRRFKMAQWLDALGVIFPFEVACFGDTKLKTEFVGHPFVDQDYTLSVVSNAEAPLLFLPGSRTTPVARIFPVMLEAYERWLSGGGQRDARVIYPSKQIREQLEAVLEGCPAEVKERVKLVDTSAPVSASVVLSSSGTMSLICALAGIPGVIVYRANPLTYVIGRRIVKIPYLGIANILLQRSAYPEYLQDDARPAVLAHEIERCLNDGELRARYREDAAELRTLLGEGQSASAVDWLLREIG